MIPFTQALILMLAAFALAIIAFLVGAWVSFKANAPAGRGFFREPKGAVFTIPEAEGAADEPEESEQNILARTETFLRRFGGEKQ
jgi:hypothetical protein